MNIKKIILVLIAAMLIELTVVASIFISTVMIADKMNLKVEWGVVPFLFIPTLIGGFIGWIIIKRSLRI